MSRALALVPEPPGFELDPRLTKVLAEIDPKWREDEWSLQTQTLTLDTTNGQSALISCRVTGCTKTSRSLHGLCPVCRREWRASAVSDVEEWLKTAVRTKRLRGRTISDELLCTVRAGDESCRRLIRNHRTALCSTHDAALRYAVSRGLSDEEWRATATPLPATPTCLVPVCSTQSSVRNLCPAHYARFKIAKPEDMKSWLAIQEPAKEATDLWLGGLHPLAFAELLYVIQQRDKQGLKFDTTPPRVVARALRAQQCESVLDLEGPFGGATETFERAARDLLGLLYANPEDARLSDEWDLRTFGLQAGGERGARPLMVDFRPIRQRWLRDLAKEWLLTGAVNRSDNVRDSLQGIALLSDAIALGPGHDDLARLGHPDIERFLRVLGATGLGDSRCSRLLSAVRAFVGYGRSDGWFDNAPGSFAFRVGDTVPTRAIDDEGATAGRALPEHVIRQLDTLTHLLSPTRTRGPCRLIAGDLRVLCYTLLRDTGRRLSDLASLRLDCIAETPSGFELIYDNVKARRRRRRLPIESRTAEAVRQAAALVAATFPHTPRAELPLFPRLIRNSTGAQAMRPDGLGSWIDFWFDEITVYDDHADESGQATPFPRRRLFPHAFRHSYAQRHADAGVEPDVLRELMDHQSLSTTMGYYTVSSKRRREAVQTIAGLRTDRHGDRVGLISPVSYGRQSVAVPYGNCQEPSNVAAGGKACPIRFQCAGCSHYRPDPSFLPAIETHISELRRNREEAIASDTATWVVDGLEAEIVAYRQISTKMKADLADLGPAEQEAINDASAVLRRMRAGAACKPSSPEVLQIGRRPTDRASARG